MTGPSVPQGLGWAVAGTAAAEKKSAAQAARRKNRFMQVVLMRITCTTPADGDLFNPPVEFAYFPSFEQNSSPVVARAWKSLCIGFDGIYVFQITPL